MITMHVEYPLPRDPNQATKSSRRSIRTTPERGPVGYVGADTNGDFPIRRCHTRIQCGRHNHTTLAGLLNLIAVFILRRVLELAGDRHTHCQGLLAPADVATQLFPHECLSMTEFFGTARLTTVEKNKSLCSAFRRSTGATTDTGLQ